MKFWASLGPGLLWAAAAVGVSHLVQSTRAGALAGFGLAGVILLALILKYPFFEFGPRYAAATGMSLVEGYRKVGWWALWLYLVITVFSSLVIQTAVVMFTSFLVNLAFGLTWPIPLTAAALCAVCAALLLIGRYRVLDGVVKVVMVVLAVSTLAAAGMAAGRADLSSFTLLPRIGLEHTVGFAFLLALVGWMPSAIDISVWSSLWTVAKNRDQGFRTPRPIVMRDFNIGYVGTGVLAFAFLTLGAALMYRTGETFSPQGTGFSAQIIGLYTDTLGQWTRPIVFTAVLTTMFSTSLTVIDGYPRAIDRVVQVLRAADPADVAGASTGRSYWISIVTLAVLTVLVLSAFLGSLTAMVDFATILSFITAPVLGYLNLRVVTSAEVPEADRPGRPLLWLAWAGLVLLGAVAVAYLVWRFL